MNVSMPTLLVPALISAMALLSTRRLRSCARWSGLQGVAVGLLPLFLEHGGGGILKASVLSAAIILIKGFVFPVILLRLCGKLSVRSERSPLLGFPETLLSAIAALGASAWMALRIGAALRPPGDVPLMMTSFFMIFTGLLLIITRRKAVMQIIGYLTLENGIFVFGSAAVISTPLLVELGVLLDAFVAVLVMGLAVDRIHIEHASTDVTKLRSLKW